MSEGSPHDAAWVASVARTRGVALEPAAAEQIAATVSPTLEAFARIVGELAVDDDMYAFRRLLAAEGGRG